MNKYALPGNPVQERADFIVNHLAEKIKAIDEEVSSVNYYLTSEGAEGIIIYNKFSELEAIIRIDGLSFTQIEQRLSEVLYDR